MHQRAVVRVQFPVSNSDSVQQLLHVLFVWHDLGRTYSLWVSADALLPILMVLTQVNLRTADPFLVSFIFVTFDLLLLLEERVKRAKSSH